MKGIVFGDAHFTDRKPSARTDQDFFGTQEATLDYILAAIDKNKAKFLAGCGDLTDTRRVSNRVNGRLLEFGQELKERGVPWFGVLGQHEVRGHNTGCYDRDSDVYLLEKAGLYLVLRNGEEFSVGPFTFHGFGFGEKKTADYLSGEYEFDDSEGVHVALVHATVGRSDNQYVRQITDCALASGRYALFGDVHEGFEAYKFKKSASGTVAIGLGSLHNMRASEAQNSPVLLLLGEKDYSFIDVPHPSAEEAFDFEDGPDGGETDVSKAFKDRLARARESGSESDEEIVRRVAKAADADKRVRDRLLQAIAQTDKD